MLINLKPSYLVGRPIEQEIEQSTRQNANKNKSNPQVGLIGTYRYMYIYIYIYILIDIGGNSNRNGRPSAQAVLTSLRFATSVTKTGPC